MTRAFIELHCHTSASFDCLSDPRKVVEAAVARGLTHLVITDHDRVDGALRAREHAPPELTVIVGEEIRTAEGDLIGAFLQRAVPPGLPAVEAIAAVRAQGGLVGIPHPFDRFRGSLAKQAQLETLAPLVDWVEVHNARAVGRGNEVAATFAADHDLAGVAVSDAHSVVEVGVAYTVVEGDASTPDGLRAALADGVERVTGRAAYTVRLWTPVAKGIQRLRGNTRVRPGAPA